MELTNNEKKIANLAKNIISFEQITELDTELKILDLKNLDWATNDNILENHKINWLKIGLAVNNKHIIDYACFSDYSSLKSLDEKNINDALKFAKVNQVNLKLIDRIAENLTKLKYDEKYSDANLGIINHLIEKIKDIPTKRTEIRENISSIRNKFKSLTYDSKNKI